MEIEKYNFFIEYQLGKYNPTNTLLRCPDYRLVDKDLDNQYLPSLYFKLQPTKSIVLLVKEGLESLDKIAIKNSYLDYSLEIVIRLEPSFLKRLES